MKTKNSNFKNGFSLIEALIAIAILIVGILSAFLLLIRTTATIPSMQARLTAVNLAQEGIEEIRALRDSDFVNGKNFKNFLTIAHSNCLIGDNCQVSVDSSDGNIYLAPNTELGYLFYHDDSGLYNYISSTNQSIFKRQIIIDSTQVNFINVTVEVTYTVKGKAYTVEANDRLYNWLNPTP